MGAMMPTPSALATRPLYVDVSEEEDKYTLKADIPGA